MAPKLNRLEMILLVYVICAIAFICVMAFRDQQIHEQKADPIQRRIDTSL
jgi:hypothetical protein